MLARLGDFLRCVLDARHGHEIVLAEEIVMTEAYLEIEKARLGKRLVVSWHLGDGVLGAHVPYLLLQPLVENAIRHGIAPRSAPGRLDIHIARDAACLEIRIGNDLPGPGDSLQRQDGGRGEAVGLDNVRARIAHLYPDTANLRAGIDDDGRYQVRLTLPLQVGPVPVESVRAGSVRSGARRMIRVCVVDDEPLARRGVVSLLAAFDDLEVAAEYEDGTTALAGLLAQPPDLAFIDVQMPGMNGLDVLAALPPGRRPLSILLTAHDSFAVRAFALNAVDYLLKPVDDLRFAEALARARQLLRLRNLDDARTSAIAPAKHLQKFSVRIGHRTLFIKADSVAWIGADGDYAVLHVRERTYIVRESLHQLARQLDPARFARCTDPPSCAWTRSRKFSR